MGKPWPERDRAPWGNGDADGEHQGGSDPFSGPTWGNGEGRAPARSPDTDFYDRPTSGGGSDSPVVDD